MLCGARLSDAFVSPSRTVLHNPIKQSAFETDIVTGLLALNPLVPKNFLPFGQKLLVKNGVLYEIGAVSSLGIHFRIQIREQPGSMSIRFSFPFT